MDGIFPQVEDSQGPRSPNNTNITQYAGEFEAKEVVRIAPRVAHAAGTLRNRFCVDELMYQ